MRPCPRAAPRRGIAWDARLANRPAGPRARGFTLVEVLVALAIVAIGMSAVLEAIGSSADTSSYLRDKALAEWIALNRLAEARLQTQPPTKGSSDGELDYAGRHWRWHQEVMDGGFPGILRIDVTVQEADTPEGKSSPWIGSASGAYGDAVAPPQSMSVFQEYEPLPPGEGGGAGGLNGTQRGPSGSGATSSPFGGAQTPSAPTSPFGGATPPTGGATRPFSGTAPPFGGTQPFGSAPPSGGGLPLGGR